MTTYWLNEIYLVFWCAISIAHFAILFLSKTTNAHSLLLTNVVTGSPNSSL